jgi:hypothetical protein
VVLLLRPEELLRFIDELLPRLLDEPESTELLRRLLLLLLVPLGRVTFSVLRFVLTELLLLFVVDDGRVTLLLLLLLLTRLLLLPLFTRLLLLLLPLFTLLLFLNIDFPDVLVFLLPLLLLPFTSERDVF